VTACGVRVVHARVRAWLCVHACECVIDTAASSATVRVQLPQAARDGHGAPGALVRPRDRAAPLPQGGNTTRKRPHAATATRRCARLYDEIGRGSNYLGIPLGTDFYKEVRPMYRTGPGADVGQSRRRCGPVPAQMWDSPGADVGQSRRRCGTPSRLGLTRTPAASIRILSAACWLYGTCCRAQAT
jgi:hypothetical protein